MTDVAMLDGAARGSRGTARADAAASSRHCGVADPVNTRTPSSGRHAAGGQDIRVHADTAVRPLHKRG